MHRVLRFKHHLRAEVAGDDLVFLIADDAQFLLRGRPYALLAPVLDGRRTVEQILAELAGVASPPEIYFALKTLEERGHVAEVTPDLVPEAAGFWQALGNHAGTAAERLGRARIEVIAAGRADPGPVRDALADAGLRLAGPGDAGSAPALRVVVTDDYLHPDLAAHDRAARADGVRWLPVRPTGLAAWIGPVLGRAGGPCWSCLAHRLRWNRPVEVFLGRAAGASGDHAPRTPPRIALPASARAAASLGALSLAWWIADGGAGMLDDHLLAIELTQLRTSRHRAARRPQCPACGDPGLIARRAHEPVVLTSQPKRFTVDGGFRTMTPEETLARCEPEISPITGALASLAPVPGRHHPLRQVYGAVYRVCPPGPSPGFDDFHRLTMGKGRSPAQARASALSEGIERVSAVFQGDEARRRATFAALGDAAIHPHALQGFSEAQYQGRAGGPPESPEPRRRVPRPYQDGDELDWTPAWSLTRERHVYLPTAYCYQHPASPADLEVCGFNPNGHAAGNCLEEAILQGFLELVERDAVGIWWYNRLRRRAVALEGAGEPYALALREHYRELGWDLWVLDVTTDLEIPVFVALAERRGGGRWSVGFGCHLDARIALSRALTELNQLFDADEAAPPPWDPREIGEPGYLYPDPGARPATAADFAQVTTDDLRDDVRACVARAAARGLETIVLDQTRPDLGLCAVKVVVPGLRHFWPRLAAGRLYDVPVALGLLPAPLPEDRLNPVPLYL